MPMNAAAPVLLVSRLVITAIATFFAIILWSRTRDLAWMLMVVGTVAGYADILYSFLSQYGILPEGPMVAPGVPLAVLILSNLPMILYGAAFAVMVIRKRRR